MAFNIKRLRRREREREYYKRIAEEKGISLHSMGGGHRYNNVADGDRKRQYGFKRLSTRQRRRLSKTSKSIKEKNLNIKCYKIQSYLYSKTINAYFKSNNLKKIWESIFNSYSDPNLLIEDYKYGYRDLIFSRIISLTSLFENSEAEYIFINYYEDIFMSALEHFMTHIDNYADVGNVTFFSYMVNIFPYRFSYFFDSMRKMYRHTEIDVDSIPSWDSYDMGINELGIHILDRVGVLNEKDL